MAARISQRARRCPRARASPGARYLRAAGSAYTLSSGAQPRCTLSARAISPTRAPGEKDERVAGLLCLNFVMNKVVGKREGGLPEARVLVEEEIEENAILNWKLIYGYSRWSRFGSKEQWLRIRSKEFECLGSIFSSVFLKKGPALLLAQFTLCKCL
ncbi:hypothetical protein C2S52_013862 [Perilla frutescens var. hirtella]|nr:hypothetical protein C2S52_013862 [Perilla frutescens var. hirtella]